MYTSLMDDYLLEEMYEDRTHLEDDFFEEDFEEEDWEEDFEDHPHAADYGTWL